MYSTHPSPRHWHNRIVFSPPKRWNTLSRPKEPNGRQWSCFVIWIRKGQREENVIVNRGKSALWKLSIFFSCKGKYFFPFNRCGNSILENFLDRLTERKETIKNFESSHFSNKYVLCSYYLQGVIVISCIYMIIYKYEYFFIDIDNSHDPGSCQAMDCLTYIIFGGKKEVWEVKKKMYPKLHSTDMRYRAWTWT